MKGFLVLTWLVCLSVATTSTFPRPRKKASRPILLRGSPTMSAARVPDGAPKDYRCGMEKYSKKRDVSELEPVPADLVDGKKMLRTRQTTNNDFYSCFASNPDPVVSDCETVLNQVYETDQNLAVTKGNCLVFEYQTCKGFFCALCDTVQVSTDFVTNQLITILDFCVENGDKGVLVGKDPPQWEAGFTTSGDGLPWYDVC